uniref:ATP synthase F0 subunit 8 n=1 Tax=Stichopus horrens TaxID=566292 RepID=E1AR77_9ECHN|nr:ATP synthase F0 subunit 8 [Stichopus horrens]ADL59817.1 ATP synthase F0 subunit 8 [Stichopus horrens]USQ67451.1 ATP synthase F0 subunit 8 [Stichopus horrens]
MPQLDLLWFLFNFLLAWLLVFTFVFCLLKQSWFSTSLENNEDITSSAQKQDNQQSWTW